MAPLCTGRAGACVVHLQNCWFFWLYSYFALSCANFTKVNFHQIPLAWLEKLVLSTVGRMNLLWTFTFLVLCYVYYNYSWFTAPEMFPLCLFTTSISCKRCLASVARQISVTLNYMKTFWCLEISEFYHLFLAWELKCALVQRCFFSLSQVLDFRTCNLLPDGFIYL